MLPRSEKDIPAVIDPDIFESLPSKRPFLSHLAIMREQLLSNLVSASIQTG